MTWGEFVEAGYLREYRAKQVTLQYLRPVIAILREELGVRYPLATLKPYTSGRSLALKVQKQVGLNPSLNIVVLGRDGTLQLTRTAAAFLEKGRLRRRRHRRRSPPLPPRPHRPRRTRPRPRLR